MSKAFKKISSFPRQIEAEIKGLSYPSKEKVGRSTIIVLVSSVILSILITLDTSAVSYLCDLILKVF